MKRLISSVALSLCFFILVSHHSPVTAADTWVSVRSKNFFILGNGSEKDIRLIALRLEQFREVFAYLFPTAKFDTPVPTTVVAFKNDSSYAPFRPREHNSGYFQPGQDVNYIALTTEPKGQHQQQDAFSIVFHEYTHLFVENTFENAPVWFNEGLAEYYATFSITDDQKIVVGTPIDSHVFLLRDNKMLPLRTLFEVDYKSPHYNETSKQGIFYAQSWALMHYLIIGRPGKGEQLGKFMELLNRKVPMERAFQEAFEMPYETMERELRSYIRQDRYNVVRADFKRKIELGTAMEVATLTEAEAEAHLGDLLFHSNRKEAYPYLTRALKLNPNLAMAHASLGIGYFREGRKSEAQASLERAVGANSQNYLAHYYYAYTLSRPDEAPSSKGYSPEVAAKVREHLQKAIALRPDYPESYKLLAFVSLVTGENLNEAIASLKRILSSSPDRHDLTYMLGQIYLRKSDYKAAREMLERVIKSDAEQQVRKHSETLLAQLTSMEQQIFQYEAGKQTPGPEKTFKADTTPAAQPAQDDPSLYLREALRKPAAGETQLQGKLVKIDCDAKGLVFVVQTAVGLLRLRTASFNSIVLLTYDPEVQGDISCGPRKPENVVVVSYVPEAEKRAKVDKRAKTDKRAKAEKPVEVNGVLKSIEFVPSDFQLKPPGK
jgi:tetratricopeptide (TPR) repeat protein